jgi:diadenosine tetraphosphate (Ap4A) HIT family hydrolase
MNNTKTTGSFRRLRDFLSSKMRMSHIYQPVMLRVLLQHGGEVSRAAIAKAFLEYDRSQLEYYEAIVRNMPGRVLGNHGIVERTESGYRLTDAYAALSTEERTRLIDLCEEKLAAYLEKRGLAPWQHRRKSVGYVPGSLRYDVIQRAKGRCEACGVSVEERALEVDHIVPRNRGGGDDLWNLQALCYVCNAQKRDRDDTDFAAVRKSYDDREKACVFCEMPTKRIVDHNRLAVAVRDAFPVTPGHILVIPKRHVSDYFGLYAPERNAMETLLRRQREALCSADKDIAGFNVGVNVGAAAGQTVFHVHVHLIPRREGDVSDPRGGVRGAIPERQKY